MPLLDDVKVTLRITGNAYDGDIQALIDACERDLTIAGVNVDALHPAADDNVPMDALLAQAVKLYCRAYFGNDNSKEGNRKAYENCAAYDALKIALALSGDYSSEYGDGNA